MLSVYCYFSLYHLVMNKAVHKSFRRGIARNDCEALDEQLSRELMQNAELNFEQLGRHFSVGLPIV